MTFVGYMTMSAKTVSGQLVETTDQLHKLEGDLSQANATIKENETKIGDLTASLAAASEATIKLQNDLAAAVKIGTEAAEARDLALIRVAALEKDARSAAQVAGENLANVGAPPVDKISTNKDAQPTTDELWAEYRRIERANGPGAAAAFYDQHRDALTPKGLQARA